MRLAKLELDKKVAKEKVDEERGLMGKVRFHFYDSYCPCHVIQYAACVYDFDERSTTYLTAVLSVRQRKRLRLQRFSRHSMQRNMPTRILGIRCVLKYFDTESLRMFSRGHM